MVSAPSPTNICLCAPPLQAQQVAALQAHLREAEDAASQQRLLDNLGAAALQEKAHEMEALAHR